MSNDNNSNSKTKLTPFHQGESEIQARAGVNQELTALAKTAINNYIPNQHKDFFASLSMVFVASEDQQNNIWSSILMGTPSFIKSVDDHSLTINDKFIDIDPLAANLKAGNEIGLLGIEFDTRRRNRVSGKLIEVNNTSMTLEVKQCYGNCPKYIQRRQGQMIESPKVPESISFQNFDGDMTDFIHSVDSLFIASQHVDGEENSNRGVDSSHRGGMPGFIQVADSKTLLIPDYMGNNFFNTMGNIVLNPKVGIQFLDYDNGHRVMLTGAAEVIWSDDEDLPFNGVDRIIRFTLDHGYHLKHCLPFKWEFKSYSPFSKAYMG